MTTPITGLTSLGHVLEPEPVRFPDDFIWGAATSAYQIEGSPLADGAGPSNWHRFTHTPGMTETGETGDVACDHYRRYPEDIELMAGLGLDAYRLSIAWSRVLPGGRGTPNARGLDFYERLVDGLLARGIRPWVTLYHWDHPAILDDRGGWTNPDMVSWFADYARVLFRALGDRVSRWMTINEPWVVVDAGHLNGVHAPGHRSTVEAPRVAHHLLLAHAAAVRVCRAETQAEIGLVVNLEPKYPASDSPEDRAATERADAYMNRQFLDPVFHGRYPAEMADIYGETWPEFSDEDLRAIQEPMDFLCVNYYTRAVVRHDPSATPLRASPVPQDGAFYTETGWEVHPESLERILVWVKQRYGDVPLYITENGIALADPVVAAGSRVEDPLRVDYFRRHLLAVHAAMRRGVDLRGYFAWSLLDNLEWAAGFSKRFGLIHVDHATGERTPKASADFYREVIRTGGAALEAD